MARAITRQQRDQFLELIRDGRNRAEAASELNLTGSAFRSLCRNDQAFSDLYDQAVQDGKPGMRDRVRSEWHRRALEGQNDRLLWYLVVSTLPEAAWFRGGKALDDGQTEDRVDLTRLSTDQLDQLAGILHQAQAQKARDAAADGRHVRAVSG